MEGIRISRCAPFHYGWRTTYARQENAPNAAETCVCLFEQSNKQGEEQ